MNGVKQNLDRLRVSGPPPKSREVEESRKALSEGLAICRAEGVHEPSLRVVVWRLLQDASETLARLPDRERGWLLSTSRAMWPEVVRTAQERFEVERERLTDGLGKDDDYRPRLTITDPTATRRMLTVLGWLQFVKARTAARIKRDKLVTLSLALGRSYRSVRPLMGRETSDSAIMSVRGKVVKQIAEALAKLKLDISAANCDRFDR